MVRELLCFVGGAACGFAGCYVMLKKRFDTMVKEEVDAAVEWARKDGDSDEPEEAEVSHGEAVRNYNNLSADYTSDEVAAMDDMKPYRIQEEDYVVDDEEYDKISLDYYTEDEGLYEGEEYIPNVNEVVGDDNLAYLHGGPDDVVYVRNEKYMTDYEICKIAGRYTEFHG